MTAAPTVLVVEDEPAILELMALHLEASGFAVWRARSAEEGRRQLAERLPDAVLVDWMLPGQSGFAFARGLRAEARTRELPILFVTARGAEPDKVSALEAGADDYVTKPFSPRELVARLRAVLRRRAPLADDTPIEIDGLRLVPAARSAEGHGRPIALSPTEFRLLHFLMAQPNRVHTRARLLDAVWGRDAAIEERTVDVHIRRLRQALAVTGHDRLIETVRGGGYRLRDARA